MKIIFTVCIFVVFIANAHAIIKNCICETGAPGLPGIVGDKGHKGEKGMQGNQGLTGPKGEMGFPGPPGDTGDRGMDGTNRGSKGEPGPRGPDAICPPECILPRSLIGEEIRSNNYQPHTVYRVSPDGEFEPVKKLKPTPALKAIIEVLKMKNEENNFDLEFY